MQTDACGGDTLDPHAREEVERALTENRTYPGALLQVLHAVQRRLGYIPAQAIPVVASALNLSRAEVHGVVTFYHYFRQTPAGRHLVQLCQAEACKSMRGAELTMHAKQRLAVEFHQTTSDGQISLEPVYCLGNCACAPAAMIDGELFGRLTTERFDALIGTLTHGPARAPE
ncbi:MAG: formate dehydrogenase subunit gamma [Steroidobacter sp.]